MNKEKLEKIFAEVQKEKEGAIAMGPLSSVLIVDGL